MQQQPFYLNQVAVNCVEQLIHVALHKDIDLGMERQEEVLVNGLESAARSIIYNLIDNAIKYGDQARVIVMDDLEKNSKTNMLYLYVIDEGPGLPEQQLEKVFEPYYRLAQDSSGNGLGLGIARSIARAHGGDLVLENRLHGGLQAILSLPRN
jgi:signal transduction histidine kinase